MSITSHALSRLTSQLDILRRRKRPWVCDADVHVTDTLSLSPALAERYRESPNYYHGRPINAEEAIAEMQMAEVDASLCWQNPGCTVYPGDVAGNFGALLAANRYVFQAAQNYPDRIIPAGWTDPKALGRERAVEMVRVCVEEYGFAVVKMNPAQNEFPIDSEDVRALVAGIVDLGAVPAFHFGADSPYTPPEGLERLASDFAGSPILGVHMGGGGASYLEAETTYQETRTMGLRRRNLFFIFSAKRDTHIESDLITYQLSGPEDAKRLLCASDAPYGRQTWNFGGFRWMFESLKRADIHPDPRIRENPGLFDEGSISGFMGENLLKLIETTYDRLISRG